MSYQLAIPAASDRTAAIAEDARAWLSSLLETTRDRNEPSVSDLCHILITSWICDALLSECVPASFPEIARRIARLLNVSEKTDRMDEVKPTLRLLVETLLSSRGLKVEPFRQFFSQSTSILRREPALELDLSFADKRMLLYRAGVLPAPQAASIDAIQTLSHRFRLSASAETVEALTLQLECLTGWGARPVDAGIIEPWLGEVISGLVVHRLRNYDLISAARLLRLHGYLAASVVTPGRDDLYDALCMHRQAHGPFGWYGPETAALRRVNPAMREEMEFYLVTTLECLWTLAERSGRWRLFGSIPRYTAQKEVSANACH